MGSGYCANWADTINEKNISKVGDCSGLLKQLNKSLEKAGTSIESFALYGGGGAKDALDSMIDNEEIDESVGEDTLKDILSCWGALTKEFKRKTGMELDLGYHSSSDEGDRYDEVDGYFWYVTGYTGLTAAGKAAKEKGIKIETKSYVTFG